MVNTSLEFRNQISSYFMAYFNGLELFRYIYCHFRRGILTRRLIVVRGHAVAT
jgi:hypothetical protein